MSPKHKDTKSQSRNSPAGWIDILFKRRSARSALGTGFRLNFELNLIADEAASRPGGTEALRAAAFQKLESHHDEEAVAMSLLVLGAVGRNAELPLAERFLEDPSELVRRAVKACLFQLRGR